MNGHFSLSSPACAFQLLLPWVRVKMHTALGASLHCWGLQNVLQTSKTKMLEDKWETTLHKEEVVGRTLILEGWHSWHAVLGDILFAELLTLQGPLFQAATVSYHLFYFLVSWYAFRNLNCSRKGKNITRFSRKIYGMCSPSPNYVCMCFCLLLSCAHTLWSDDIAENP